jgi:hypothetical protein
MSWRTLIVFLLLAGVASWQGGIQLGEWLVSRAPESIASASSTKETKGQVLDASGKPFTPQPPQPRVDGTLGIPRTSAKVEWTIIPIIASFADAESLPIPVDSEGNYERRDSELAAGGRELSQGQSDVATLDIATNPGRSLPSVTTPSPARSASTTSNSVLEGVRISENADPTKAPVVTVYSWVQSLKKEIEQCASLGFFQRPTCVQNARNKYCGPNNGWGNTADCPPRD